MKTRRFFQDCNYFCYQQDHFGSSLRRCGRLGSSFGCELLNGKQTICSQDGNDHLHCNDRHRGSYYWSQLHPALPPPQWGEIHKIHKYTNAQNHNILKVLFKNWDRKCLQLALQLRWSELKSRRYSCQTLCATKWSQNLRRLSSHEQKYWWHQPSFPHL